MTNQTQPHTLPEDRFLPHPGEGYPPGTVVRIVKHLHPHMVGQLAVVRSWAQYVLVLDVKPEYTHLIPPNGVISDELSKQIRDESTLRPTWGQYLESCANKGARAFVCMGWYVEHSPHTQPHQPHED